MKINGSLAVCAALVAVSAFASSAFAWESLGSGLRDLAARATADDSFFAGSALTLGDMSVASDYEAAAVSEQYGECASCAGNAAPVAAFEPVFEPAYAAPATFVYDDFGYDAFYSDFNYGFAYARPFQPVRTVVRGAGNVVGAAARPVASIVRGVRNFLFGRGYDYCLPAYVCDPCWSVCDPCWSPCAEYDVCNPCAFDVCDPCAVPYIPQIVYAPGACCGAGFIPGSTRELDPETGAAVPDEGLDSQTNAKKPAPKSVSTDEADAEADVPAVPEPAATPATVAPATIPANSDSPIYSTPDLNDAEVPAGEGETVPARRADPTLGTSVIKMLVPENSVVFVNGYRTKQKGDVRTFVAKDLEVGESYTYDIRVVEKRDGKIYEDFRSTTLVAGEEAKLAFNPTLRSNETYAYNAR